MVRGLVALTLVTLIAACASSSRAGPGSGGSDAGNGSTLEQRAHRDLASYDRVVTAAGEGRGLQPVGPLTQQIGQWVPSEGGDHKMSFAADLFTMDGHADPHAGAPSPRTGQIRWADRRASVPLISAAAAVKRMSATADDSCAGCVPLRLSRPRLGVMKIGTTRGSAQVPAWIFAITGSAVHVAHPAIATDAIVRIAPDTDPADGLAIESATLAADGQTLTVSFTGAPGPANKPCGADYTALAVESANAVVVIVNEHRMPGNNACPAIGAPRTATVKLAAPLADRAVLELPHGTPVSTTTA